MKYTPSIVALFVMAMLLPGCGQDHNHPTPTTDGDRIMESYLANVQKIGGLLAGVQTKSEAQAVTPQVMLIVGDMRKLQPKMKAIDAEQQADTMTKYRVKIHKVNEQFTKDVTHFVNVPGASEDLIKQLKSLPTIDK